MNTKDGHERRTHAHEFSVLETQNCRLSPIARASARGERAGPLGFRAFEKTSAAEGSEGQALAAPRAPPVPARAPCPRSLGALPPDASSTSTEAVQSAPQQLRGGGAGAPENASESELVSAASASSSATLSCEAEVPAPLPLPVAFSRSCSLMRLSSSSFHPCMRFMVAGWAGGPGAARFTSFFFFSFVGGPSGSLAGELPGSSAPTLRRAPPGVPDPGCCRTCKAIRCVQASQRDVTDRFFFTAAALQPNNTGEVRSPLPARALLPLLSVL